MRNLQNVTNLKAVENSTENMNDEERCSTQTKAANVKNKKCKKAMKKQVQNQTQHTYIPPTMSPQMDYELLDPEREKLLEPTLNTEEFYPQVEAPIAPQVIPPAPVNCVGDKQQATYTLE